MNYEKENGIDPLEVGTGDDSSKLRVLIFFSINFFNSLGIDFTQIDFPFDHGLVLVLVPFLYFSTFSPIDLYFTFETARVRSLSYIQEAKARASLQVRT